MVRRRLIEERMRSRSGGELNASEQKFRDIYDNTAAFIGLLDADGTLLDANRAAIDIAGIQRDQVLGRPFWETPWWTHSSKEQSRVREAFVSARRDKEMQRFDTVHISPEGKEMVVDFMLTLFIDEDGEVRNYIAEGVDITEKRATEEQLRQSQKMDAIGQLAGDVAHDFNNMIGGIIGATELLQDLIGDNPEYNKLLKIVMFSGERAAELARQLLAFGRKQRVSSSSISFHDVVNDAVAILSKAINRRITITVHLNAENDHVVGDPAQLQSVFLNLGINASHAMPDGGELTFESRLIDLDRAYCDASPFTLHPGTYVDLSVRDTGCGIPPENLQAIFEP